MLYLLLDILRIFIMVEQKEYQRSLALQILCLLSGSRTRTPYWLFWKAAQPAFNEGLYKQELSSLTRAVSNDPSGCQLAYCDKQFKTGGKVRKMLAKSEPESLTDPESAKWSGSRMIISAEDGDTQLVLQFFLLKIRQLSIAGQFLSYTGAPDTWINSVTALTKSQHTLPAPMLTHTAPAIRELLIKVRAKLSEPWNIDLTKWSNVLEPRIDPQPPEEKEDLMVDLEDVKLPLEEVPFTLEELVLDDMFDDDAKQASLRSKKVAVVPLLLRTQSLPRHQVDLSLPSVVEEVLTSVAQRTKKSPRKSAVRGSTTTRASKKAQTRQTRSVAKQQLAKAEHKGIANLPAPETATPKSSSSSSSSSTVRGPPSKRRKRSASFR
jgi:hypothetical protein